MTAKVSLVPNVIDALLTKIRGLTATVLDAEGNSIPILVFDGYPGSNLEDTFVSVGGGMDPTAESHEQFISLGQPGAVGGAPARDETATIRIYVQAYVGGADETGQSAPDDAQKTARDHAYTIVSALAVSLRGDPQLTGLGGAVAGVPLLTSGWCELRATALHQTNELNAAQGRIAFVECAVDYYARLYSL